MVDGFNKLYDSLFTNSANYKTIVTALAKSRKGLPRKDLAKKLAVKTGGTINRILENLREAGFIAPFPSYGKKKRGARYRLIDEYSYFYLHWIRGLDSSILNDPRPSTGRQCQDRNDGSRGQDIHLRPYASNMSGLSK